MVAMPQPTSLIEDGIRALSSVKSKPHKQSRVWPILVNLIGTLTALMCFVIAAFVVSVVLGLVVLGVAVLLLDFKAVVIRRGLVK